MATEQAQPANPSGAEQAPPTLESRLVNFIGRADAEEAEGEQPESAQPDEGQAPRELTPEDLPDVEAPAAQPADESVEIEWNGQKHQLTRDELIKQAQQGFDYTQKTMALAETAKQVHERLQRVAAIEQVQPHLQAAQGQIMALQAQLQPYQNVDWVRWASEDPLEYSKGRAQYDTLVGTFQRAVGQYQQINGAIENQRQILGQQVLHQESQQLVARIPEWKDPEKFKAGAQALRQYLISEGATPQDVDSLTSSIAVSVAVKAMKYDQLLKAKGDKVKQLRTAPPVTRPGAAQSGQASADKNVQLTQRLKKTGDLKDAAAVLLNRMR